MTEKKLTSRGIEGSSCANLSHLDENILKSSCLESGQLIILNLDVGKVAYICSIF